MATIPSKQLHRVGNYNDLLTKLLDREIGFDSVGCIGYIKLGNKLKPLHGNGASIPNPSTGSVLVGTESGETIWDSRGLVDNKYSGGTGKLWTTIGGNPIQAQYTVMDSENHFVSACEYIPVSTNPIYGNLRISQDTATGYMEVSVRRGNSKEYIKLGGLLPDGFETANAGDYLCVGVADNAKGMEWGTPDSQPTANSSNLITSGAVYAALQELRQLITNIG